MESPTPKAALNVLFQHACHSEKLKPFHYPEMKALADIVAAALPSEEVGLNPVGEKKEIKLVEKKLEG